MEQCCEGSSLTAQRIWPEETSFSCPWETPLCSQLLNEGLCATEPQSHWHRENARIWGKRLETTQPSSNGHTHTWIAELFRIFLNEILRAPIDLFPIPKILKSQFRYVQLLAIWTHFISVAKHSKLNIMEAKNCPLFLLCSFHYTLKSKPRK